MSKLMLVEDDNNLREIYGARLMAEGYDIISAADGEEALALAVKEKPDLIISDVMMPKISGFDMLDILRTTPETKDTKIIMMTALSQPEDRQRGESLGADKYLVKSQVTLEDVVAAVHEILGDGPAPADPAPEPPVAEPAAAPAPSAPPTEDGDQQNLPPAEPQPTSDPNSTSGDNASPDQTEVKEEGSPDVQQPPDENPLPKADGASDAPEPASRKKKVIAPINDLTQDKDKLMQMVAEETALEAQNVPSSVIDSPPTASPDPADSANAAAPPAKTNTAQPEIAQAMAAEKAQMEQEVQEMLNNGVIDQEANAAPVEPSPLSSPPIDNATDNAADITPDNTDAPTPVEANPAAETPTPMLMPEPETPETSTTPTPTGAPVAADNASNPEPMLTPTETVDLPTPAATPSEPTPEPMLTPETAAPTPPGLDPTDTPVAPVENDSVEQDISDQIAEMVGGQDQASQPTEPSVPTPAVSPAEVAPSAEIPLPTPQIPAAETGSESTPVPQPEVAPDAPSMEPAEPETEAEDADNQSFDPKDPHNIAL